MFSYLRYYKESVPKPAQFNSIQPYSAMKSKSSFRLIRTGSPAAYLLAAAIAAMLATPVAQAATLYWDPNTTTAAFGTGGTWPTNAYWTSDSTGAFADLGIDPGTSSSWVTTSADNVVINKGNITPWTMAVTGDVNANSLTYSSNAGAANAGTVTNGGSGVIHLYASGLGNPFFPDAGGIDIRVAINVPIVLEAAGGSSVYIGNYPGGGNNAGSTFSSIASTNSVDLYVAIRGAYAINDLSNFKGTIHNEKAAGTLTIGGLIGANVTTVTQNGAGALTLGNAGNAYTGKTTVQAGTLNYSVPLSIAGSAGPLGAPSGANATIDLYPGTSFVYTGGQTPQFQSSDRIINLAGMGAGTVILNGTSVNDTNFTFTGGFAMTGLGPRTLQINARGDRPVYTYGSGAITNMSDGSPLSLTCVWSSGSSSSNAIINLQGANTFTGPMVLTGGGNGGPGVLLIGGSASVTGTTQTIVSGTGTGGLGSGGNYAGNVTFTPGTVASVIMNYASTASQTLSGVISGPGALTMSGTTTLTLTNANTFTGATTVTGGKVVMGNALALQNSPYNTTGSTGVIGLDITGYTTPILGGLAGNVDLATAMTGYGAVTALTLNPQAGVTATYSAVIGDNGNSMTLTKTGAGTQVLTGTNLYTGTTTISGGALQANEGAGLPANFLSLDGGTLQSNGTSTFTRSLGTSGSTFQFTANGGGFSAATGQLTVNIGGASAEQVWGTSVGSQIVGTLQLGSLSATAKTLFENPIDLNGATRTINVGANTAEISGIIQTSIGTAGLIKTGAGTLILSGANTYNGPTTLNAGALTLTNGSYSGGITVNGGTLTLPIGYAGIPTLNAGTLALSGPTGALALNASPILVPYGVTLLLDNTGAGNNIERIDDNQAITFSGGTLNYKGSDQPATNSSETVGGITLAANTASKITLTKGGTNTVTVDLKAITRNAGSMLNFSVVPDAISVLAKTTNTNTNNILGTWATVGATNTLQYAANNGSDQIVALGATGTTPATPGGTNLADVSDPAVNYSYSAAATLGGNKTGNTLRYTGTTATTTALGTNSLTLNGLMNAGTNTLTISNTALNPGLVIGANGELDIISNDKNITISSVISGTTGTVVYSGGTATATLGLSGVNTFGGGLIVNSGTISLTAVANVLGTGPVTLMPGTTLAMSNAALTNSITITDASITSGNSFGGSLSGDITLGGVVTLALTGEGNEAISSNISGSGGLTQKGVRLDALTALSGTNTYTGATTIASSGTVLGALKFTNRVSLYNANADSVSWTAAKIIVNPAAVAVFAVGGAGQFISSDITTLAGLGTATGGFASGSFIGLDTTTASYSCDSVIANPNGGANVLGVQKFGNNTLTLTGASAYTGQTRIYRGSLQVSSINSVTTNVGLGTVHAASSNLGAPTTVADGTIIMGLYAGAGTLIYAGDGETTDRVIALNNAGGGGGSSGAIIDQSGAGLLKFTSDLSVGTLTGKTITFQGSNLNGTGEFAGRIPGASIAVTKNGTGTWTLSGVNSYTGVTTVSQGKLLINGTNSGTGAVSVSANAALGGTGTIAGNTTVAASGKLAFNLSTAAGSHDKLDITGSLTFSGASALDITASGAPAIGVYTLVTAAGGISGLAPATLNLPVDWAATASISGDGKSLLLDVTSIGAATDYDTWAGGYLPDNVSDPAADFDGDGLSNFQEYAFGLNPTSGASVNPISQQLDKTTGLFKYTRRATPATTGVTYTYESSTTLSGTWPGFTPDSAVSNNATPVEEITVDVPDSLLANPALFLRVKALQP